MIKKIFTLIFVLILAASCSTNDKHVVVLAFSKQLHAVLYNDNSQSTKTASKTYIQKDDNEILLTANIISFDFDSYELKNEYNEGIDEICKYLNNNRDINLIIEGHSDSIGDSNYNIYLSENRAKAIFDKLVDKGIDKDRLRYIGYGSTHSSEYNDKDRKCQFVIINNSDEEQEYKKENETDIIKLKQ
ncbi:lipoprotein [Brachyspira hyodysenteriae]|uniref:OmpA family protein n=1 Tax=Brachyspira hyodysenteriae TaxID=159 RepID=UPI00063DD382|nr:OmpA family protein [Brachyspira hyodysenteriae]KLI37371.1 lipoprotein [Brachyspira hyodysenteriae]